MTESPPTGTNAPACLLCDARGARILWTLTGQELRLIFEQTGRALSERAYGAVTRETPIHLFECTTCEFQFFDPALVGSGEFYAELEAQPYYPETRPEFDFALRFCRAHNVRRVLDVGGGEGAYLDAARDAGFNTCGIELNAKAAAAAAAKGHTMVSKLVGDVSPKELGGPVDFLSFFQVVEHVPEPRRLVAEAARLLTADGHLMVSVPNREAPVRRLLPYDPLDMPPHHLSRWRPKDLDQLATRCGLRVVATGADVLYGDYIQLFWLLHNRIARAIGRPSWPGGSWLPKLISFLYRKLGCRYYLPPCGMGIYTVMRRA